MTFRPDPKPEKVIKKKKPFTATFKATGEAILFKTLISTRKHLDFITGLPIENIGYVNCHHVLGKAAYPKYRLFDKNIVFLSDENHYAVHNIARSELEKDEQWKLYFEYFDKLKELYYKK